MLLNSLNRDRTKEETLDPIGIDRTISIYCLDVGSIVRYAGKERGCLCAENSACQAIYNVGWFGGC